MYRPTRLCDGQEFDVKYELKEVDRCIKYNLIIQNIMQGNKSDPCPA
jgi:hypothetical protein